MRLNLYQKIFIWFALNLALLGLIVLLVSCWVLFGNSEGLLTPQVFSQNINTTIRLVASNLQYKPVCQWPEILKAGTQEYGLDFRFQIFDAPNCPSIGDDIPSRVLQAARRIPKPPYSLCPVEQEGDENETALSLEMAAGVPPAQLVIFMRAGEPPRYWFGCPIFVADDQRLTYSVLLTASSDSITGNGQFFNITGAAILMLGVLGLSCLWWWPFVRHISRPLKALTETTERIVVGDYSPQPQRSSAEGAIVPPGRGDEIGRLAQAISIMAEQVKRQVKGQRRFIRYIAHEMGSPLGRVKFGLAVLESRLDGDARHRVEELTKEMEQLTGLVEDVLGYLRDEAAPNPSVCKAVLLYPILRYVVEREAHGAQVEILVDKKLEVWADKDCLRRALANVLRNAVRYAGRCGPIVIKASYRERQVFLDVCDSGPGVKDAELVHLMEPFFRGDDAAAEHPGGSGLGLSIVKHCVEDCKGTVSCRNRSPDGFEVNMVFHASERQNGSLPCHS